MTGKLEGDFVKSDGTRSNEYTPNQPLDPRVRELIARRIDHSHSTSGHNVVSAIEPILAAMWACRDLLVDWSANAELPRDSEDADYLNAGFYRHTRDTLAHLDALLEGTTPRPVKFGGPGSYDEDDAQ